MTTVRAYFIAGPAVCGVPKDLVEAYEPHLGKLFDIESKNHDSSLARKIGQSVEDRMGLAYDGWVRYVTDPDAFDFFQSLGNFAATSYGFNKYAIGDAEELAETKAELQVVADDFPEITALMTVDEASMMGINTSWN